MSYETHHATAPHDVSFAILTISDTKGPATDQSGDLIQAALHRAGHRTARRAYSRDDVPQIRHQLRELLNDPAVDAVVCTGGTGVSPRDVTVEAIQPLFRPELPGFGEVFRTESHERIQSGAILSRATAGIVPTPDRRKPVFLLPGSPEACELAVERIIAREAGHLVQVANGGITRHA